MLTVRDMVKQAQADMLGDLAPADARAMLVRLTSLLGNCADEQREADLAYAIVLRDAFAAESKSNRAKIVAECSPEYTRSRLARDTARQVLEMVRTLKAYMRSVDEEMRLTR